MGNLAQKRIFVSEDKIGLGKQAGQAAAAAIRDAIAKKGQANIILATGTSQFETLRELIAQKDIDWSKVVMFHLDEYIGLPLSSKASFRKYLQERVLDHLPPLKKAVLIDGETDPEKECDRLSKLISANPIDIALVGIGENGHLAFNDPPADFDTTQPYIIVELDAACRKQQFAEGWFDTIDDVPHRAISMSIHQVMLSKQIICSAPDARKAVALSNCLTKPVSNLFPASILQQHPACAFYLDKSSAALLNQEKNEAIY